MPDMPHATIPPEMLRAEPRLHVVTPVPPWRDTERTQSTDDGCSDDLSKLKS
jgi:hypothetical protein